MNQRAVDFRRALGRFATGVAIVSVMDAVGRPAGMTISSFNSVSLEPPLILFSIARSALSLPILSEARSYAVNILAEEQAELSSRFAKSQANKWYDVDFAVGQSGAPLIHGALAHFECEPYAQYDGGDHVIFVGRVGHFNHSAQEKPLVFFEGRYRSLQDGRQ